MDWRRDAVCTNEDPELFFPVGTSGPALLQIAEAKAVCRRCPVSGECLAWALASGQEAGVWGGLSEDERRAIKRRQARPSPAPAPQHPEPGEWCNGKTHQHLRTEDNTRWGGHAWVCLDCDRLRQHAERDRRNARTRARRAEKRAQQRDVRTGT